LWRKPRPQLGCEAKERRKKERRIFSLEEGLSGSQPGSVYENRTTLPGREPERPSSRE
jgi:hypothetical protein